MKPRTFRPAFETLERRRLLAWSGYAQLIDQDVAAENYAHITGEGVTVAVIDTGIDYAHSSLGGGFGPNHKVIGGYDFYADDADPMDESGHGTAVAGVIAAEPYTLNGVTYQGVAPDARLVALRVGTDTSISDASIERALRWVLDNHAAFDISIVNLSLGSGNFADSSSDSRLADEFAALASLGIFVVAASGNSNDQVSGPISQDGIAYPAADPSVFAVGAVDANDVIVDWVQRGDELDLLAPGADVVAPVPGGSYAAQDGTSFAAPHVAGAAALVRQADPTARGGDIGSILMSSGVNNRDGSGETGNTTTLQFARLDIDNALRLVGQRRGRSETLSLGKTFDTALDSQGVLHAAFYDTRNGDLMYATRDAEGLWSRPKLIDAAGDVGAQLSIAVDGTGKVAIGYFDVTNTSIKYAAFDGFRWTIRTIDSAKHVGTNPSLAFDIDGNAYLAYERRSGGYLRLAALDRDSGRWTRRTVDGGNGTSVGSSVSLDVGEAALRDGFFTRYDTTVAIAYADDTNGNLKYARLDLDDPTATWFVAMVDDTSGVRSVALNLHGGPTSRDLQAQIAYQDASTREVRYAYRNTDWFVETAAAPRAAVTGVQLWFDGNDLPTVTYYNAARRAIYSSTRVGAHAWSARWETVSSSILSVGFNERTGESMLSYLDRGRTDVFSNELV